MGNQLSLDDVELTHSRATDPPTSTAAARTMTPEVRARQQAALLLALHRRGDAICEDLADDVDNLPNRVARRLGDLRELGLAELTGGTRRAATGRLQCIHRLTDAGRREALRLAGAGRPA